MTQRRPSYAYEDLLACGRGELFGNAQLPLPPLLMLDRITSIGETGGAHGKGQVVAELKIAGNPRLEWIFSCHFTRDPVMPGCFMLDALWQMTGFFLGWLGATGRNRPLGVGKVKLTSMVTPVVERLEYVVDLKEVTLHGPNVAVSDGSVKADGELVYAATDLRVRLFEAGAPSTWIETATEAILRRASIRGGKFVPKPGWRGWSLPDFGEPWLGRATTCQLRSFRPLHKRGRL